MTAEHHDAHRQNTPSWFYPIIVLVAFNVAIVMVNFILGNRIISIYQQSLDTDRQWADLETIALQLSDDTLTLKRPANQLNDYQIVLADILSKRGRIEALVSDVTGPENETSIAKINESLSTVDQSLLSLQESLKAYADSLDLQQEANIAVIGAQLSTDFSQLQGDILEGMKEFIALDRTATHNLRVLQRLLGLLCLIFIAVSVWHTRNILRQVRADSEKMQETNEQRQLMQLSLDFAAIAVVWVDRDGDIQYANDEAKSLLGLEGDIRVTSTNHPSLLEFDDGPLRDTWPDHWKVLHHLGSETVETVLHCNESTSIEAEMLIYALKTDQEDYACAVINDVTDRNRAQQRILNSEERFSLAITGSDSGIWDWEIAKETIFYSPRFRYLLGYTEQELSDNVDSWITALHPEEIPLFQHMLRLHLNTREPFDLIHRIKCAGGGYKWFRTRGLAIWDDNGRAYRMAGSISDISELKDALVKAEAASRTKSRFLATMSHEVRTPLNGALGMARLLSKTSLDDSQHSYVTAIQDSGVMLMSILNDILDFSKIEAGKLSIETIPFDANQMLSSATHLFKAQCQDKGLDYEVYLPSNMTLRVLGDPTRIQQIISNLINNAIKFTENGFVNVTAEFKETDDDYGCLTVKIKDSGIGISEEQQKKLFSAFTQADSSTTRKYGGTGLGLSICSSLVEMMNGKIGIESSDENGSCFFVEIPLKLEHVEDLSDLSKLSQAQAIAIGTSPEIAKLSASIEKSFGTKILYVNAIEEAEALFKAELKKSHFIICDHVLHDGNSLAIINSVKHDYQRNIPIFIISPRYSYLEDQLCIKAGATQYFGEGVSADDLRQLFINELNEAQTTTLTDEPIADIRFKGHVLLVEDTEINIAVAQPLLEDHGLTIDVARNGAEALQKYKDNAYDLILMDCLMPIMDGYEATRRIRLHEQNIADRDSEAIRKTTIVALTANAIENAAKDCLDAGMDDFLAKPIVEKDLVETLLRRLERDTSEPTQQGQMEAQADVKNKTTTASDTKTETSESNENEESIKTNFDRADDLLKRFGPDRFAFLVKDTLQQLPELMRQLREASDADNFESATRAVHTIKSSVRNYGADALRELAQGMEHQLKQEEWLSESEMQSLNESIEYFQNDLKSYAQNRDVPLQ